MIKKEEKLANMIPTTDEVVEENRQLNYQKSFQELKKIRKYYSIVLSWVVSLIEIGKRILSWKSTQKN